MTTLTNEKIKYFVYARKSSDSEDRQVQSIDDQIKVLKEIASRQHFNVVEIFTESKSAKKPNNRPVFTEMITRIEKGEAQGILCWKLNRLARNPVDGGTITWLLQNDIIKHIKTNDGNFYPQDNVLLISVEFGIANQYIIDLRKDCRRGMIGRAERGWLPTLPPAGYVNDKNERCIAIDATRFPLIRRMWDLMLTGNYNPQQIRHIANNEWGYRTKPFKRIGGTPIANSTLYKLFNNIFYTGLFEWGGKLYQGKHTPMITLEEYDRVQVILGKSGRPRPQRHTFAFTGMVVCAECGCMVTASEKSKWVKETKLYKTYVYYHCSKRKKALKCKQKPLTLKEFEDQIQQILKGHNLHPIVLECVAFILNEFRNKEADNLAKITQTQEEAIDKIERAIETLVKMRYNELVDDQTFKKEQSVLQDQLTRLKHELAHSEDTTEKWIELTLQAFEFAVRASDAFEKGTVQEKREILASIGSNYTLNNKKLLFDKAEWLITLEKCLPPIKVELQRLEPIKTPYYSKDNVEIQRLILQLRSTIENIRTTL
jgi:site-specific DNA recombinase